MIDVLESLADASLEAHTGVVLTYNLDLVLYDKLLRRRLTTAGATNQIVFCDATCYRAALDGVDPGSRIGHAYSVTPVARGGAFHPKAYLLLGRRRGRLILGSGNASLGGLVRNAEIFGQFDFDADDEIPPHPAFGRVMAMVEELGAQASPAVRRQLARAREWSPWLEQAADGDGRVVHVGGVRDQPLRQVLERAVGAEKIKRIVAVTASFDRQLEAVNLLATLRGGGHPTIVVVQSDRIVIDGRAVRRLPRTVRFTEFIDPRPSKKREPHDCYAHAKLYVIETATADLLFFGSANLSTPAWTSGANAELLVEVARTAPNTWVKRLGLAKSLEEDVRDALGERTWKEEPPDADSLTQLGGIEWSPPDSWSVVTCGPAPAGVELALGRTRDVADAVLSAERRGTSLLVADGKAVTELKFGWLVDAHGRPRSHPVALTWPDVVGTRGGGWFDAPTEHALRSMGLGDLLQPVLFELLDRLPDLDVLGFDRSARKSHKHGGDSVEKDDARTVDSFYTSGAAGGPGTRGHGGDDDTDLEILAALIQPLSLPSASASYPRPHSAEDTEDNDDDDGALAEEAERQRMDAKGASMDGSDRPATSLVPTAAKMLRAGRRLVRRLERAAESMCSSATKVGSGKAKVQLPPRALARQVMMTYIAAAAAERPVATSDEGEITVVDSYDLAHYVLQCGAALSGLLTHLEPGSWESRDGTLLAGGLRFVVAACAWATAYFEQAYKSDEYSAVGIHDAVPLFVLARLLMTGGRGGTPDFDDAKQRIAAWPVVETSAPAAVYERALSLAMWIDDVERAPAGARRHGLVLPGSVVHINAVGVAVVLEVDGDRVWVAIPARPARPVAYKAKLVALDARFAGQILLAPLEDVGSVS